MRRAFASGSRARSVMGGERGAGGRDSGERAGETRRKDRYAHVTGSLRLCARAKGVHEDKRERAERGVKCSPKVPISSCCCRRRRRNKCRIVFFSSLRSFCSRHHETKSAFASRTSARCFRVLNLKKKKGKKDFCVRDINIFHNCYHPLKRTARFFFKTRCIAVHIV